MAIWENWLGSHAVLAEEHTPGDVHSLVDLVATIAAAGGNVRAVGSGHSTSRVAQPLQGGDFVDMRHMKASLTWPFYKPALGLDRNRSLARVEAGITIRELNRMLDSTGWALPTMGSYDGQTIAGVISTATHGSGLMHQTIADAVRAIEIVTMLDGVAQLVRIEPTDGPTDLGLLPNPAPMRVIQDNDTFYSAVVGLGLFGIVYAVTLEVRPHFWLHEHRYLIAWEALKPTLIDRVRANPMYFDLAFLPHGLVDDYDGRVLCLVTERAEIPYRQNPPDRHDDSAFERGLVDIIGTGLLEWLALEKRTTFKRKLISEFRDRASRFTESVSYIVSRTSLGDVINATSIEMAVPIANAVAAMDRLIALAAERETPDDHTDLEWFHTSPVGVRFQSPSAHYLAPSYDRETCTLECPLLVSTRTMSPEVQEAHDRYREHMMAEIEMELMMLGGRPHWGQTNYAAAGLADRLYPMFTTWKEKRAAFDPTNVFQNAYSSSLPL